jgi:hypothetical protein
MTLSEAIRGIKGLVIGNELANQYAITTEGTIWILEKIMSDNSILISWKDPKDKEAWKKKHGYRGDYNIGRFRVDMECFDLLPRNYYNTSKYGKNYKQKVAT